MMSKEAICFKYPKNKAAFAFETFASALEVKNRINVDFLIEHPHNIINMRVP